LAVLSFRRKRLSKKKASEEILIYITLVSILLVAFFLTRFYWIKQEIKSATKQLNELNGGKSKKKLDLTYFDKDFEELASEINDQIDLTFQAYAEKQRTENELKQAIANISHDIRTPMTSILGYIQFLEMSDISSDKKAEYIAIIKNGAGRLKVLLEDFF
jgi:signal transduction histidine kinase